MLRKTSLEGNDSVNRQFRVEQKMDDERWALRNLKNTMEMKIKASHTRRAMRKSIENGDNGNFETPKLNPSSTASSIQSSTQHIASGTSSTSSKQRTHSASPAVLPAHPTPPAY